MSEEDDEDETEILPVNHNAPPLEWDDEEHDDSSPLSGAPAGPRSPSQRSYRV